MLIYNRPTQLATSQLIAQAIQSKQLIVARPGTPLYDIASPCVGFGAMGFKLDANDVVTSTDVLCSRLVNDSATRELQILRTEPNEDETTQYGISSHSASYIGLACAMAEVIKRNLELCGDASAKVKAAFDSVNQLFTHQDIVVPINIIPLVGGGDLANAGTLLKFAQGKIPAGREASTTADVPTRYSRIEDLDQFPILKLISTGNSILDSQLKEWAAIGGAKLMQNIYNAMFCYNATKEPYWRVDQMVLETFDPSVTKLDVAIGLLLLGCHLEGSGVECGSGITLEELEFGLMTVRIFSSNVIVSELARLERQRKAGIVVHQYPREITPFEDWRSSKFDIIVDKVTYDEFLSKGGRPEILFGAYLKDHIRQMDHLLERGDEFVKAWADGEATLRHKRHQDEVTRIYREVRNQCYRDYNELSVDMRAGIDTANIADALDRFNAHLGKTGVSHLYDHMRELYCTIFYSGTEVKDLLRTIDEVSCDDTMSREAVLRIAIVEYCSRLLMEQTESIEYVCNTGD